MKKPKSICSKCHKVKRDDCELCKKVPFEGIKRSNYKLYNSSKWRKFSKQYKKDNPLCCECLKEGVSQPSEITDHIKPLDKGGDVWDLKNLQPLCHHHHNKKTGRSKKVK